MTKRKDHQLNMTDLDFETELMAGLGDSEVAMSNNHANSSSGFQLHVSGLKPKLDSIFSEVEKNLPEIDFDFSDVGSDDEEPLIFHQQLKSSEFDEEKDLDTSQESATLGGIRAYNKQQQPDNKETEDKNAKSFSEAGTDPIDFYDNDLAFELQKNDVSTWSAIPNVQAASSQSVSAQFDSHDQEQTVTVEKDKNSNQPRHSANNTGVNMKKAGETRRPDSQTDIDDKHLKKQVEREKSRSKELDAVSNFLPPQAPVLSTQALDNINLDLILQSLNEDNQLGPPAPRRAWSSDPRTIESVSAGGEGPRTNIQTIDGTEGLTLIQRLAQMTMEQCGEDLSDLDPSTGARPKRFQDKNGVDNRDLDNEDSVSEEIQSARRDLSKEEMMERELNNIRPFLDQLSTAQSDTVPVKKVTSSCGTSTSDFTPRIITPRTIKPTVSLPPIPPPQTQEKKTEDKEPTVFIDLRNFDQRRQEQQQNIERVQRVLGIDQSRADSSESEDDDEDWQKQRQKFKVSVSSWENVGENVQHKPPSKSFKKPTRVTNLSEQTSPRTLTSSQSEETLTPEEAESRRLALEKEREKERRMEVARKIREQRETERQTKLRLQKRLEAMRPTASVSGRHDAAENTPILFDLDASYEPAPRSLPTVISPDRDCLLLNIHLSSNGEIILHRGKNNKSVDTGDGLSASYTSLLTWLLSLVPDNFSYLQREGATQTEESPWILPFHVIGCQQALLDDQLSLTVAVTPVEQFDARYVPPKSKKSKLKDEVKGTSPFHQHLSKFLATNTLLTVCPWLQDMVSMEMTSMQERSEDGYVYRPPLPNITTKPLSTFVQINPDPQAAGKVFNTAVGFFWQTVDSDEKLFDQSMNDESVNYDTQNTMSLVYKKIFKDPRAMMGIFNRILQEGLDLAGVRLLYPTSELLNLPKVDNSEAQSEMDLLNNIGPVLAVSLRGTLARSIWLDAVGPSDPVLARRTDPNSLCALYGGTSREECLLFCPRNPARVLTELARWFGGRVPPGNVIDVGAPYTRKDVLRCGSPKGRRSKKVTFNDQDKNSASKNLDLQPVHRPLATLTSTIRSEIFLVLSALVPPKCFGIILATCQRRGYQQRGIKRCRLSTKRAACLGITGKNLSSFCPGTVQSPGLATSFDEALTSHLDPSKQGKQQEATAPVTILLLQRENATHSVASLVEACMVQLTLQGIMGEIQSTEDFSLQSRHMLHAARFSDSLLNTLGGDFSKCFDPEIQINPSYVIPQLYTNAELEQVTVLLLLGHDILKTCGIFVGKLLNLLPYSKTTQILPFSEGLELLGLKWLPSLSPTQAKEMTPWEVGDKKWKHSLHTLTSEPCLALAFRGVNAFQKLDSAIPSPHTVMKAGANKHIDMIHSRTAEEAYAFARLVFTERELFPDHTSRPLLPYIPHELMSTDGQEVGKKKKARHLIQNNPLEVSIFDVMLAGPQLISTFLLIKPRAVQKHLPKILKKITQEGFQIIGLKLDILDPAIASRLLPTECEASTTEKHMEYLTSGPSLCLCVQRENAVRKLLDLLGPEDPQSARRNSQFYWRGVFGADPVTNAFYASAGYQCAVSDQKMFFPDGLCCEQTEILQHLQIACPAVDSVLDIHHNVRREIFAQSNTDSVQEEQYQTSGLQHHLLLQTTCVVLTPTLMRKLGSHYGYVDVIEGLISHGFEFVGARMVWFTQELAETCLCLMEAGSFKLVPLLLSGPSIVLALQRDNAVVAFDTLMAETFSAETVQGRTSRDSILSKYGKLILRPADVKQAKNVLSFFFDKLLPNCQLQIVPKFLDKVSTLPAAENQDSQPQS